MMTKTVPLDVFQRERKRRIELEQFIKWEDELFENGELSTSQRLIARATRRAVLEGKPREDGLTYISMERIAERAGVSVSTARRGQQYLAQLGAIERKVEEVPNNAGEQRSHVFVKLTDVINTPSKIIPEKPRNHGGQRLPCPACGSHNLKIQHRLICKDCGSVSVLHEHEQEADEQSDRHDEAADLVLVEQLDRQGHGQTSVHPGDTALIEQVELQEPNHGEKHPTNNQPFGEQRDRQGTQGHSPLCVNLTDMVILESNLTDKDDSQKPASPPVGVDVSSPSAPTQSDPMLEAAQLLLDIAGPSHEHVEMSQKGPAKYYTIHRALTLQDMIAHIQGKKTVGAFLRHPDGKTRALCYDTDDEEGWQRLKEAARLLPYGDYCPILEESPVRGGHLWVMYNGLVDAKSAHRHLLQYAPMLRQIKESWPGPGPNKVRLPGGRYVSPNVSAWCKLIDERGAFLAPEGYAAQLLLDAQVPAELVPEYPLEPEPPSTPLEQPTEQERTVLVSPCVQDEYDGQWQAKYGHTSLWFHFTPAQLAAWYNAHHDVREILLPEKNKMGLATWRGERTASIGYTKDGEGWVDFGASAMRSDGKRDGGDALELQTRVMHEPKAEILRQAARGLLTEARAVMEGAARNDEQPATWVAALMTEAGWSHYWKVRKDLSLKCSRPEATISKQPVTDAADETCTVREASSRLNGFSSSKTCTTSPKTPGIPYELVEHGLTHGEPCPKCGCPLYRDLMGEPVCCRCFPQRGYHEYSTQVDALYPRKRREEDAVKATWKSKVRE